MSNNIYGQQMYGQGLIASNSNNIVPITYQKFSQNYQQPIFYGQNQCYIVGVYNQQQPLNLDYNQYTTIPGFENKYQQLQNHQQQNIYHQNNQMKLFQQNQNKNIYQQQALSHQHENHQTLFAPKNPHIIQKQVNNISQINQLPLIEKQCLIDGIKKQSKIMTKDEIDELYSYENAICKIKFKIFINGEIKDGIGTGFFLEINDNNIPFEKALFTNNHILNKNSIEMNKEIVFEYCKEIKKIKITENRNVFTNEILDYTCIEIFDTDKINNFFKIGKKFLIIKMY